MMNKKMRIGSALLGVSLMACSAMASAQTVEIGGTTLDLGASRADTLAVANAQFDLSPTRTNGQYNLYPKRAPGESRNAPYPPAIGSITVRNNRLTRVTHNLGSFRSPDADTAIENLIAAFSRAPNEGDTPSVHTDTALSGDASTSRVYFSYPDRAIQIVVYRPAMRDGMATIDITEQYALRDNSAPQAAPLAD